MPFRSLKADSRLIGQGTDQGELTLLSPAAYAGGMIARGTLGPAYSDGTSWRGVALTNTTQPGVSPSVITEQVKVTVGPGGDFTDLPQALAHMAGFTPATSSDTLELGIVEILSGHECALPVHMSGVNLSWVTIISQDAEVPVLNTAYATTYGGNSEFAFMYLFNARGPRILCKFACANESWSGANSDLVDDVTSPANGEPVIGVKVHYSTLVFPEFDGPLGNRPTGMRGFSTNVSIFSGSNVIMHGQGEAGDFTGAKHTGLHVNNVSLVKSLGADFSGAGVRGAFLGSGAKVFLTGADWAGVDPGDLNPDTKPTNFRRQVGVDGSADIQVSRHAEIVCLRDDFLVGGSNVPKDTISKSGLYMTGDVELTFDGFLAPAQFASVAAMPAAADYEGRIVYCATGDAGSPCLAFSNGTNWLRIPFGAAIAES